MMKTEKLFENLPGRVGPKETVLKKLAAKTFLGSLYIEEGQKQVPKFWRESSCRSLWKITVYAHLFLPDKPLKNTGRGSRDGWRHTLVRLPAVHGEAAAAAGCPYMACVSCCPQEESAGTQPGKWYLPFPGRQPQANSVITQRPCLSSTAVIRHRSPEAKTYWALGRRVGRGGWRVQTAPGQSLSVKWSPYRCCKKYFYMRRLTTTSDCPAVQNMWVGATFHGSVQRHLECLETAICIGNKFCARLS